MTRPPTARRAASSDETFPPPPFEGFAAPAFAFFRDLAINNEKSWFNAHKADYEANVREPMLSLLAEVSARLKSARVPLTGDPQKAIFRINRDVRFSANKNPYKTHAGAVLTADGRKGAPGLLYIHFDPVRSFTAAGFFRVEPPVLQKLRRGLAGDPAGWVKVERALAKSKLALAVDEPLVRLPKGFETAPVAVAETLKLKSWIVRRDLPKSRLGEARLVDDIVTFAVEARPLLDFGWAALAT